MDHNVDGYSKEKSCEYIDKKLKGAGCQQDVFEDREAIINASAEIADSGAVLTGDFLRLLRERPLRLPVLPDSAGGEGDQALQAL